MEVGIDTQYLMATLNDVRRVEGERPPSMLCAKDVCTSRARVCVWALVCDGFMRLAMRED